MNTDIWTTYANDGQDIDIMVNNVIDHLQQGEIKLDLFMSGGGTNLVPLLMGKVGCSKYINQVRIPYSTQEFNRCLDPEYIEKYCTANAAFRLASETRSITHTFRIGITASLQNKENPENQREGRLNHAYVCFIYENKLLLKHVQFLETLSREEQEYQLAYYVISLMEQCFKRIDAWDMITPDEWSNALSFVNTYLKDHTKPVYIYSGSFRPIHKGHIYIKDYDEHYALLEIPFQSFGKDSQAEVDDSVLENVPTYFRLSKTRIVDKLEFLETLMDGAFEPEPEESSYHIYRMGSDTLRRISNEEFETLNSFKHWKFQIFDREATTEDMVDLVESKLTKLERYEYISMPKELRDISSTKIRESQNKQNEQ